MEQADLLRADEAGALADLPVEVLVEAHLGGRPGGPSVLGQGVVDCLREGSNVPPGITDRRGALPARLEHLVGDVRRDVDVEHHRGGVLGGLPGRGRHEELVLPERLG